MRKEDVLEAMSYIDEDYIMEARESGRQKRRHVFGTVAAALALGILTGMLALAVYSALFTAVSLLCSSRNRHGHGQYSLDREIFPGGDRQRFPVRRK